MSVLNFKKCKGAKKKKKKREEEKNKTNKSNFFFFFFFFLLVYILCAFGLGSEAESIFMICEVDSIVDSEEMAGSGGA